MSESRAKTLGEDLTVELIADLNNSLHKVRQELERSGETLRDDARAAILEASLTLNRAAHAFTDQVKARSGAAIIGANEAIREHPVVTAAAIVTAAAALTGLVVAARWPKAV
jgi:ElaB/YqjD/DUF883 family membrane-anchored ribosome-binding protein